MSAHNSGFGVIGAGVSGARQISAGGGTAWAGRHTQGGRKHETYLRRHRGGACRIGCGRGGRIGRERESVGGVHQPQRADPGAGARSAQADDAGREGRSDGPDRRREAAGHDQPGGR